MLPIVTSEIDCQEIYSIPFVQKLSAKEVEM